MLSIIAILLCKSSVEFFWKNSIFFADLSAVLSKPAATAASAATTTAAASTASRARAITGASPGHSPAIVVSPGRWVENVEGSTVSAVVERVVSPVLVAGVVPVVAPGIPGVHPPVVIAARGRTSGARRVVANRAGGIVRGIVVIIGIVSGWWTIARLPGGNHSPAWVPSPGSWVVNVKSSSGRAVVDVVTDPVGVVGVVPVVSPPIPSVYPPIVILFSRTKI